MEYLSSGVTTRFTSVLFNNFGVRLTFHVVPSSGQDYNLYLQKISCTPCLMLINTVCLSVPHLQSHSLVPRSLYCHFVTIHQMPLDFLHRHNSSNFPYQPCRCLSNPFGIVCLLSVWPFPASLCCKPFHLNFVHKSLSPCCRPTSVAFGSSPRRGSSPTVFSLECIISQTNLLTRWECWPVASSDKN